MNSSIDFKLRPWSMDDLPSLVKYAANFDIAKNMMDSFPHPYSKQSRIDFIEMTQKTKNLLLCIEINGEAAGSSGIHLRSDIYKKNAEIGYWLAEPYWGNGIISRVIPIMVDKGFETFDIERIFANVFGRNKASQCVLEKNGFVLEGQFEKTI
jgi:ribosomal-protein-alanine N-acetyltransferase